MRLLVISDLHYERRVYRGFDESRAWEWLLSIIDYHGPDYLLSCGDWGAAVNEREFYELLRRERILDAARSYMLKGLQPGMLVFKLNKQAAYVGRVSFADMDSEVPMGPITFIVETRRPMDVVNWLAPETRMGRPIREYDMPEDYGASTIFSPSSATAT
jgi:predicted RNA binding protein with dsRBD fold (UPF0201 family)